MPLSTSKSSTTGTSAPELRVAAAACGVAVSVDVEEWYHSCWIPEYVDPLRRPRLPEELDHLLPGLLDLFEGLGVRATFFVLGEVAERLPERVREIAAAGHEVACHGRLHLRADDRSPDEFRADLLAARDRLEQTIGAAVVGYRAPEWSLRSPENPRLRLVAEAGFRYDSSLVPSPGAGRRDNPRRPVFVDWTDELSILELPPLVWGGPLRLPAGGWTGRCAPTSWVRRALERAPFALLVVHPWELVDRPAPGLFTGFARLFHDAGRTGFRNRFADLARALRTRSLKEVQEAATAAESTPHDTAGQGAAELSLAPSGAGSG